MSSASDPPPPPGPPGDEHVSFVQRLEQHYGRVVDPEINLQDDEDDSRTPGSGSSSGSSSSRGLVARLSDAESVRSRYGVQREIARGGMGVILRVWDDDLRRNLAMKVMHGAAALQDPEDSSELDQERLSRFLEEAQITGQLDHPGIVPVHDLGVDDDGRCYFTMRLVRGRELKDIFDLSREGKEGWTRTKVIGLVLKVCEAMAYAHSKGVVHRDLKPSNVMVGRFGETYVMDWGLARVLGRRDSHDLRLKPTLEDPSAMSLVRTVRRDEQRENPESPLVTMDGDVVGTPAYMAPEQARGKLEEVGPRSDVYSLGAILYYMLTGRSPYVEPGERVSPHTVLNRVLTGPPHAVAKLARDEPAELVAVCEKAMARDPEERYVSMLEVADDLQAFLENRVVSAYEGGSVAEFKKWVVRNRGVAASLCALFVLVIASAVGFGVQKQRRVDQIAEEQAETARQKERAEDNLALAQENERKAKESERKAKESENKAKESEREALAQREEADRSAAEARRSGYIANVLATDYSIKLNDVAEARRRLDDCERSLRGWEWDHLHLRANAALVAYPRLRAGLSGVAFDARAERVLLLSQSGRLSLFERTSRKPAEPRELSVSAFSLGKSLSRLPLAEAQGVELTPDGAVIALVGTENRAHLFDALTGEPLRAVPPTTAPEEEAHGFRSTAVAFHPKGRTMATGAENGEILIWNFATGERIGRLQGHLGTVTALGWDPRGRYLASTAEDGTGILWDVDRERVLQRLRAHSGSVHGLAWSRDGNSLFTCGEDRTIQQWRASDGSTMRTLSGHTDAVRDVSVDPVSGVLASASLDRTVRLWNVEDGTHEIFRGHLGGVVSVAFGPDGRVLLSGSEDGEALLFDVHGDLARTEFEFRLEAIQDMAFSPDGSQIVTGDRWGNTLLWDAVSGEPLRRHFPTALNAYTNAVAFRPDGKRYASAGHDKTVRIFATDSGREVGTLQGYEKWIQCLAYTPDGTRLVVGSGDKRVRVHDAESSLLLNELRGHRSAVNDLVVSRDGRRLASAGRHVRLWDMDDLEAPPRIYETGRKAVRCLDFHPQATLLAAGLMTGKVLVWRVDTDEPPLTIGEAGPGVWALGFSHDGRRLAIGSSDGLVRIVDPETGDTFLTLQSGREKIEALSFSPDGTRLAVAGQDEILRIWETGEIRERRGLVHGYLRRKAKVEPIVEQAFEDYFHVSEVLRILQRRQNLDAAERETAIRMALVRGDDPSKLYLASFRQVLSANANPDDLVVALQRAEAAMAMPGGVIDPRVMLALGMARYRSEAWLEAASALQQALDLDGAQGLLRPRLRPVEGLVCVLFQAMASARSDDPSKARQWFDVAEGRLAEAPYLAFEPSIRELVLEAEGVLAEIGAD